VRTAADELEDQLDEATVSLGIVEDADADGEPDPSYAQAQEEEEEEEGQDVVHGLSMQHTPTPRPLHKKAAPPPPPTQQTKARAAPPKRSAPNPTSSAPQSAKAARVSAAAGSASSAKPRPKPVLPPPSTPAPHTAPTSTKRAAAEHPDVEEFVIAGPIAPASAPTAKRTTVAAAVAPSQGQASSFSLALPTASAGPDPLAHQGLYGSTSGTAGAMESDDEWDEILAQPDRAPLQAPPMEPNSEFTITIEEEADADADDGLDFLKHLERELLGEDEPAGDGDGDGDEELEEEDQEDQEMMSGHVSRAGGPMSMNQFAGGDAAVEDEDDDYSSSEESEED
jgi:hypothetical protein